jgi:polysaccharide export outer membrane protein
MFPREFRRRNFLCLLGTIALAGCSAAANVQSEPQAASSYAAVQSTPVSAGSYILGPGDRVRIKVYSDADMTGEYEVNSNGFVSVPLVGEVKATGSTTRQLERIVADRMRGKISQDPRVNVEIAAYAPFYIYGEVRKAGVYPFQPGLTVADAIATAGGLTYRANEEKVYVRHAGSKVEDVIGLDTPFRISPRDNIRVSERIF